MPPSGAAWYVPSWLTEAVALPEFRVIDTRSAQGRLEPRPKVVTIADLILLHGHLCDGLLRGAYALRALFDVAFGDAPVDRTDLLVVSKNSPCLGDVAAYLTGGRARFGTHRLDDALGVGFQIQQLSTGRAWEVREEPGFFPPLIARWEAALIGPDLPDDEKRELIAVNEEAQWDWVRTQLLPRLPADRYAARELTAFTPPPPLLQALRTDTINRSQAAPAAYPGRYRDGVDGAAPATAAPAARALRDRYQAGPDAAGGGLTAPS